MMAAPCQFKEPTHTMEEDETDRKVAMVTKEIRQLTTVEIEKLEQDTKCVTEFKQQKLEKEAQKNWDLFYKRNTTKFFKDRHWTKREFSELINRKESEGLVIFEVGCGVGNFMFPLLEGDTSLYFYACDFSKRAVEFVKASPKFEPDRCTAFHCDITADDLSTNISTQCVNVATMIFVLSAIHPEKMVQSVAKIFQVLKPGGCLLLRDYGLYDHAMLRFAPGHKLSDQFYVRQDGTRAYYFTLDELTAIMREAGFSVESCEYIQRQTVNKKEGLCVPRIFVQGKFMKPVLQSEVFTNNVKSDTTDVSEELSRTVNSIDNCVHTKEETENARLTTVDCVDISKKTPEERLSTVHCIDKDSIVKGSSCSNR